MEIPRRPRGPADRAHDAQQRLHVPVAEVRRDDGAVAIRLARTGRTLAHGVATRGRPCRSTPGSRSAADYEMRHATVDNAPRFRRPDAHRHRRVAARRRFTVSGGAGYAWLETMGLTAAAVRRRSASAWIAPVRAWAGTSAIAGRSCRRSVSAAHSRTRNSRPGLRRRSRAASIGARVDVGARGRPAERRRCAALRSIYARSSLPYLATRWMRIEGYYVAVFQDTGRAGGKINRSRVGVQVVTTTRKRIR